MTLLLRDAEPGDFKQILLLNQASVHFLSPLTAQRLALLHGLADCHRVAEHDGRVSAFLLAFAQGADYDSPNYQWFAQRYERFLYVDRIVVDAASVVLPFACRAWAAGSGSPLAGLECAL